MIAIRPSHVFESMGPLENSLFESATSLVQTFQGILDAVSQLGMMQRVPSDLTAKFPPMLAEYLKRFKAWKGPDEIKLTCRIKHALIALYQAGEQLPKDEPADSKIRVELATQIARLRSKLAQIAGKDALKAFDEQIAKSGYKSVSSAVACGGEGSGGGASAYDALPGRMTNEQLAHELLLDRKFQLDDTGGAGVANPVFHRIRESFHKAFWDSLSDDLKLQPPCYVRILRVLREIRDGISDLAGQMQKDAIYEAIDIDFITERLATTAFDWNDFKKLVGDALKIIKSIQAPARDVETNTMWEDMRDRILKCPDEGKPRMTCEALEFLLLRVNTLRVDAANAR